MILSVALILLQKSKAELAMRDANHGVRLASGTQDPTPLRFAQIMQPASSLA